MFRFVRLAIGLFCAGAVVGCSGQSDNGTGGSGGNSALSSNGGDMSFSSGGTGLGAGGSFAGSGGGSPFGSGGFNVGTGSGGAPAAPVPCGNVTCMPAAPLFPGLPGPTPCCADATTGTCGTSSPFNGGACATPPAPDPRCASSMTMLGNFAGCCTNNDCGLDLSSFGLGCTDTSNPMFSMFLPGTTPTHCDGTPIQTGSGGGQNGPDGGSHVGAGGAGGTSGASDAGPNKDGGS